MILRILFWP